MPAPLPPTVKRLGLVSLLNDASSEMIYPLLPAFLTQVLGASPAFLGAVEGMAEAVASLLKLASGWLTDRLRRRKPAVVAGYATASLARPLIALAARPLDVLALRLADRLGKGVRSAPRDALVAEVTRSEDRGRAYGFHRAMDHTGAVIGPLLASAVLWFCHDLRLVFALAAVPAAVCVLVLIVGVKEAGSAPTPAQAKPAEPARRPSGPLARYLVVLAVFTLGNSSDAFLLLRAQQAGLALTLVPLLWTWHHVVKAGTSTHAGAAADRFGHRNAILLGWAIYALVYAGFARASTAVAIWILFGIYGLFHAFTEGPERALVAAFSGGSARGRAFGLYHAVTGAMLLPASLLTGWLWQGYGPAAALGAGAGLAGLAAIGLLLLVPTPGAPPAVTRS
jgi:MFS family permease